jgi:hypothetical protein
MTEKIQELNGISTADDENGRLPGLFAKFNLTNPQLFLGLLFSVMLSV